MLIFSRPPQKLGIDWILSNYAWMGPEGLIRELEVYKSSSAAGPHLDDWSFKVEFMYVYIFYHIFIYLYIPIHTSIDISIHHFWQVQVTVNKHDVGIDKL